MSARERAENYEQNEEKERGREKCGLQMVKKAQRQRTTNKRTERVGEYSELKMKKKESVGKN